MTKKIIILIFLIVQLIYPQNTTQIVLVGGTAHIGNGETIENCVIMIKDDKIEKIGSKDTLYFDETKYNVFNTDNKHIYPSLILPNTTLGLAEIDAVRASRDEREVGLINSNVRSQIAFNTESIIVSTVKSNGILLAQITPRGGLISGSSSIMKLEGENWKDATYFQDDGIHINWPEDYHRTHWTHSHDFTAKDKEIDKEDAIKKKIKSPFQNYMSSLKMLCNITLLQNKN